MVGVAIGLLGFAIHFLGGSAVLLGPGHARENEAAMYGSIMTVAR
jgi:hypothetical protein